MIPQPSATSNSHFTGRFPAIRLDVVERLAVHTRRAVVDAAAGVRECQDVTAVHLVVEGIEAIVRRALRFRVQGGLKFPNRRWRC